MGGMWWGHIEVYPYNHQTNLIKAIELKNTNFNKITNLFLIHFFTCASQRHPWGYKDTFTK